MYLAHFLGEHQFQNQWQPIWHVISNWLPHIAGIILVIVAASTLIRRRNQAELIKIRNK